jgi:hypothetical protein
MANGLQIQRVHRLMQSTATEIIELVFERVDEASAVSLSNRILENPVRVPTEEEGVSEVEIQRLSLGGNLNLNRVHLRILRYEGTCFDVELNFALDDVDGHFHAVLGEALHRFANRHADAIGVQSYYAGLEPAVDEDTRLFTGSEKGPFLLT